MVNSDNIQNVALVRAQAPNTVAFRGLLSLARTESAGRLRAHNPFCFNDFVYTNKTMTIKTSVPTQAGILSVIPPHCHQLDFLRSSSYALMSLGLTVFLAVTGHALLPTPTTCAPLVVAAWSGYAVVTGTVAFGLWVIGHECGHQAF